MKRIVLVRHGESLWNKENRFTGWTDVDLSAKGVEEAKAAGRLLTDNGFVFGKAYTSYLKRAVKTLNVILDEMNLDWIPVAKSWRLNEKHYGVLQGLNKSETAQKFGQDEVMKWRRSYDVAPDALSPDDKRSPLSDLRYASVPRAELPLTEALCDTIARTLPYWECEILPALQFYDDLLVVAHGNSLRGIVKHLKNISDSDISALNIPTAAPWVFEFDDGYNMVKDYFLGDQSEIERRMASVANQAK